MNATDSQLDWILSYFVVFFLARGPTLQLETKCIWSLHCKMRFIQQSLNDLFSKFFLRKQAMQVSRQTARLHSWCEVSRNNCCLKRNTVQQFKWNFQTKRAICGHNSSKQDLHKKAYLIWKMWQATANCVHENFAFTKEGDNSKFEKGCDNSNDCFTWHYTWSLNIMNRWKWPQNWSFSTPGQNYQLQMCLCHSCFVWAWQAFFK